LNQKNQTSPFSHFPHQIWVMKKITVSELLDGENRLDFSLQPCIDGTVDEVKVNLLLTKAGKSIHTRGDVCFTTELECARCLKKFEKDFSDHIDIRFLPFTEGKDEVNAELTEEGMGVAFYEGDEIDLEKIVVDSVFLSIPMKSLCKVDCKGLCPKCGKDLNEGDCDCTEGNTDSR